MNNYSFLEQLFHKIVLSSKFLKEVNFDLEKSFFLKYCDDYPDNHVFITGLARSGTTILLNSIHQTNIFGSLTYDEMPFILSPNLWSKINGNELQKESIKRTHGDGIIISTNSPEAFEEVFWMTFKSDNEDSLDQFFEYVKLILYKKGKVRYLSKNNQNVKRIDLIKRCFPNSKILIPFRDPLQHSYSLLVQHKRFIEKQEKDEFIRNYMKWIGHSEFGIDYEPIISKEIKYNNFNELNHWLEQWLFLYQKLYYYKTDNKILFICYEDLCGNDLVWDSIQSFIGINDTKYFEFIKSTKEIRLPYNEDLYNKCLSIYQKLKDLF